MSITTKLQLISYKRYTVHSFNGDYLFIPKYWIGISVLLSNVHNEVQSVQNQLYSRFILHTTSSLLSAQVGFSWNSQYYKDNWYDDNNLSFWNIFYVKWHDLFFTGWGCSLQPVQLLSAIKVWANAIKMPYYHKYKKKGFLHPTKFLERVLKYSY